MNINRQIVSIALLSSLSFMSWAGNKAMMENMAKELIQLNETVVQQLGGIENNEKIQLEARVVEKNGKKIIVIEQAIMTKVPENQPVEKDKVPSKQAKHTPMALQQKQILTGENYTGDIRYESLPKQEHFPMASQRPMSVAEKVNQVSKWINQYPKAKVIKLQPNDIRDFPLKEENAFTGGVLIYW